MKKQTKPTKGKTKANTPATKQVGNFTPADGIYEFDAVYGELFIGQYKGIRTEHVPYYSVKLKGTDVVLFDPLVIPDPGVILYDDIAGETAKLTVQFKDGEIYNHCTEGYTLEEITPLPEIVERTQKKNERKKLFRQFIEETEAERDEGESRDEFEERLESDFESWLEDLEQEIKEEQAKEEQTKAQ